MTAWITGLIEQHGYLGIVLLMVAALGHALEANHGRIAQWLDPVAKGLVGVALGVYVYRVLTFRKAPAPR
jgi:hypothetical protein